MTVAAGFRIPPFEVAEVSAEKMKTIAALLGDPNPIHWDLDAVAALGMGDRPINQGPLNMGYVINMLAAWAGGRDRVRRFRVRFRGNVRGGDHLIASGVVTDVRTEDGVRLAECEVSLDVVDGAQVLSGTATVQLPEEAS